MSTYLQNIDLVRQDLEGLPHLSYVFGRCSMRSMNNKM